MTALRHFLDLHSSKDQKILVLSEFSVEIEEANMKSFGENYNLKSLIKQPTCYKNSNKNTHIDLILTSVPRMFQSTCVIETGLSDLHLITVTVMGKLSRKYVLE